MTTHLIQTVEDFQSDVERKFGPGAQLHPSNRVTACGRHGGSLHATTDPAHVTCKVCARRSA